MQRCNLKDYNRKIGANTGRIGVRASKVANNVVHLTNTIDAQIQTQCNSLVVDATSAKDKNL